VVRADVPDTGWDITCHLRKGEDALKNGLKKTLAVGALAAGLLAGTASAANAVAVPPGGGGSTTLGYYSSGPACVSAANYYKSLGVTNLHCWLSYTNDGAQLWTLTGGE
jgi:hypothetical protein